MKITELNAVFTTLGDGVDALNTEIVKVNAEVTALAASLGGDLPADAAASLARVQAGLATLTSGIRAVDDIIPDGPVVITPTNAAAK